MIDTWENPCLDAGDSPRENDRLPRAPHSQQRGATGGMKRRGAWLACFRRASTPQPVRT